MDRIEQITQDIQPILDQFQIELYEINLLKSKKHTTLQIAIMHADGSMDIETCANVSEQISILLDEKDYISEEYFLEVCSAGAERALRNLEEIKHAVGSKVFVKFVNPVKSLNEVTGVLVSCDEDTISFSYQEKAVKKSLQTETSNVKKIRLSV